MNRRKMNSQVAWFPVAILILAAVFLAGCSTTPDESYKASQMTKSLEYPPDLIAPVINQRFFVSPEGSAPISTPIPLPETPPVPRKPKNKRGGGGHSH